MILLQSFGSGLAQLFFPIAIVIVAYFFILRPNTQKQESVKSMQENLSKGDKVVTVGGIHGKVTALKSSKVVIKVSNESELTVDKVAIAKVENSTAV